MRAARVRAVVGGGEDLAEMEIELLDGPLRGKVVSGLIYRSLGAPPEVGESVAANTVGLEMGLGTGGVAIVLPSGGGEVPENRDHFVKLPYTPMQFPASPAPQAEDLNGIPLAVLALHSHLAPACCAAADLRPGCRIVFVWQEGGALPAAFSATVRTLRDKGLLHSVVSTGNCFGGDLESPNVYSGLLAAARDADLVLAGIGPGVIGTDAPYGHGGMSAAQALNAAISLGGEPVVAPRLSSADSRDRHRGMSHHTRTVLGSVLGSCRVALPESAGGIPLGELPDHHGYVQVAYGAGGLEERFGVTFESMGRNYTDDKVFFDAAAASVALALGEAGGEA